LRLLLLQNLFALNNFGLLLLLLSQVKWYGLGPMF
jgi:hypothetical protein